LPLYLLLACAGLTDVLQRAVSRLPHARGPILACTALLFPLWFSAEYLVIRTDLVAPRGRSPTGCRSFQGAARVLAGRLSPGDRILAVPDEAVLHYYLRREGKDDSTLFNDLASAPRVFVVTSNASPRQSLEQLMETGLPKTVQYGAPSLIEDCANASVYELDPAVP